MQLESVGQPCATVHRKKQLCLACSLLTNMSTRSVQMVYNMPLPLNMGPMYNMPHMHNSGATTPFMSGDAAANIMFEGMPNLGHPSAHMHSGAPTPSMLGDAAVTITFGGMQVKTGFSIEQLATAACSKAESTTPHPAGKFGSLYITVCIALQLYKHHDTVPFSGTVNCHPV